MRHTGRRHSDGTFVRMDGAGPFAYERRTAVRREGLESRGRIASRVPSTSRQREGRIGLWRAHRNAPAVEALRR